VTEPDYRFTYANERTFLAWVRTSVALIGVGVAAVQFLPPLEVPGGRRAIVGLHADLGRPDLRPGYFSRRDRRRSARGLPSVWHVAQYWSDLSANDTSRTVSPQRGQG
jgi:hypothetical protein